MEVQPQRLNQLMSSTNGFFELKGQLILEISSRIDREDRNLQRAALGMLSLARSWSKLSQPFGSLKGYE
jgi:hypothetical protein